MVSRDLAGVRIIIYELEFATRPVCSGSVEPGRHVVSGWPRVDHPAVVRAWLGDGAVDDDGCLADPEAAGWALAYLRWWSTCRDPGSAMVFEGPEDDRVVEGYLSEIRDRLEG